MAPQAHWLYNPTGSAAASAALPRRRGRGHRPRAGAIRMDELGVPNASSLLAQGAWSLLGWDRNQELGSGWRDT